MSDWREGLTHKDWLFDGSPIRGEYAIERFNSLDWSKAWIDMGPSIAGNLGPYWHVPMDDGDTTHRLYPKVLLSKWLLVIRQACEEHAERKFSSAWQPIITIPKSETVLAWWLNGEQHTGSTDGERWFPAWEHQDNEWAMPQLWRPLSEPDEGLAKHAVALAVSSKPRETI